MREVDVFIIIILFLMAIDNYRLRVQYFREVDKLRVNSNKAMLELFKHTNNVLFAADILSEDELCDGVSTDDLIEEIFVNIVEDTSTGE